MLLVAAATQANVRVQSQTGAEEPHRDAGRDDAATQSSSGEARATSAPTLFAVTEKQGNNESFQNGSNADFSDRVRIVNGTGQSVRLNFGASGSVTCSSEPGGVNPSGASARAGVTGGTSTTCSISCANGVPTQVSGCEGATLQGRVANVILKSSTKFSVLPDDLKDLVPNIQSTFDIGQLGSLPALATLVAQAIKQRGFTKGSISIPAGTDVKVGFEAQVLFQLPAFSAVVPPGGVPLLIASILTTSRAIDASYGRAEISSSLLSATTEGPVPPGLKIVFENSQKEVEVRQAAP
jgi:hypothetical protein